MREATRYTAETVAYQKEFKASDMGEKALSGFGKDMVKSGVRSGTKMDESTAALNRARLVNSVQTRRLPLRRLRMVFRPGYGTCIRLPSCDRHQTRIFLEGASMVSKE